jgi:hypothetical protein
MFQPFIYFLYGCKIWTLKQSDVRGLNTEEIKLMRSTAECSLSYSRRNGDILEELKLDPVECIV